MGKASIQLFFVKGKTLEGIRRSMEECMRKKDMLFLMCVTVLVFLGMVSLPHSSLGITPQDVPRDTPLSTAPANLRVEKIIVTEIGNSHITSSDGRIIRFNTTTNVYKKLSEGNKMVSAELHYVDGKLVAIYIFR
jgi:hypothetical protein